MNIGAINNLKIVRNTPHGLFLKDENNEEVLLPGKYLNGGEKEGDDIDVFIYNDSEDRLVATTLKPKIQLHEFAALKVVDVTKHGVFMDWGLEKDLLVPFKEQNKKMEVGESYVVKMYLDEDTERLVATARIKKYLSNENLSLEENEKVDLMVFNISELGFDVIINEKHLGLIYNNEVFSPVSIGQRLIGFIKRIRDDNKIDVSLQPHSMTHLQNSTKIILDALEKNDGLLPLSDSSSPEEIYKCLNISKKVFKKAIGNLYKQHKIVIEAAQIKIVS